MIFEGDWLTSNEVQNGSHVHHKKNTSHISWMIFFYIPCTLYYIYIYMYVTKGSLWAGYLSSSLRSKGVGGQPLLLIYQAFPTHFWTPPARLHSPPGPSGAWGTGNLMCSAVMNLHNHFLNLKTWVLLVSSLCRRKIPICIFIYIYIYIFTHAI